MGYIAKLEHGAREIKLSSGNYALMPGFVPPTTPQSVYTAAGTSANRHGGASFVGKRANNMSFVFAVRIMGKSGAEVEMSREAISSFLNQAGDEGKPVYFAWKADNNLDYDPMWGQFGALRRCVVVSGKVDKTPLFTVSDIRDKAQVIVVSLQLKPYAQGLKQRVGTAKGGICEDWIGAVDGISRGVQVPEASGTGGNLHENPIFGHATYNNHWVDDANVTDTENNDEAFILFGISSVKLYATGDDQYTESLTLTNNEDYILSYYVKKPDSSAVTSADVAVHYDGSDETTTYTSVGDGWYRISATATGDGAAGKTGVTVKADALFYMDGAQCELKDWITPFFYGDMLGCAWAGAAHATASTRTVSYLRYPGTEVFSQEWSCRIVWKADKASTGFGGANGFYFMDNGGNLFLQYDDNLNRWRFSDNVNWSGLYSGTFSKGDIIVIHCTVGPTTGAQIYINSTAGTADASFVHFATPTWLYVGSTNTPNQHSNGTFLGFATFDREMTATEVTADYDNITEWVGGGDGTGQRLEAIPWLWTKDGDDEVDTCDGPVDGANPKDHHCVVSGIPGDVAAETEIYGRYDTGAASGDDLLLSIFPVDYNMFIQIADLVWNEEDGTADVGTSSNDAYLTTAAVGTSNTAIAEKAFLPAPYSYFIRNYYGKEVYLVARIGNAADTTLNITPRYNFGASTNYITGDPKALDVDTTLRVFVSKPITIEDLSKFSDMTGQLSMTLLGAHDSGTNNVYVDFFSIFPRPTIRFDSLSEPLKTEHYFRLIGTDALIAGSSTFDAMTAIMWTTGDPIDFVPHKLNILQSMMMDDSSMANSDIDYVRVYVKPRYEIL